MTHGGTITEFNGVLYIVWEKYTLYEQFRDMRQPIEELQVDLGSNGWRKNSVGGSWKTATYRMKLKDFERITGEKEMTKQTEKTEQPKYPVNEWFTADGETVPLRDGYFLMFETPDGGDHVHIRLATIPAHTRGKFCYIPIPEKQVKPLQGIGLNEPKSLEEYAGFWTCASSDRNSKWIVRTLHHDKETAIEMHNAAMETYNAKAAGEQQ
jgi:hypothetical protein